MTVTRGDRSLFRMRRAACANRRFKFEKRRQLLIRTHNETLSVAAVRIDNKDRSPVGINRGDAAPTPHRRDVRDSKRFVGVFRRSADD
jgi:hypothetical protein